MTNTKSLSTQQPAKIAKYQVAHGPAPTFGPNGEIVNLESAVGDAFKRGDWVEEEK